MAIRKEDLPPPGLPARLREFRTPTPATWAEILAKEQYPAHLDTAEGRFLAALEVIKNGAMVLELLALSSHEWKDRSSINSGVRELCGNTLPSASAVYSHQSRTFAPVGAAEGFGNTDRKWRRTAFGTALLPASIYAWKQLINLRVNPAKAMTSHTMLKRDDERKITGSAALNRAIILLALLDGTTTNMPALAEKTGTSTVAVRGHLNNLVEAGLIDFKSANSENDSLTFFSITNKGKGGKHWTVEKKFRGKGVWIEKVLLDVRSAAIHLTAEGKTKISIKDVVEWLKENRKDNKGIQHEQIIAHALGLLSAGGFLEKSELNHSNMSSVSITEKGRLFTSFVLVPLIKWATAPNSVVAINELARNHRPGKDFFAKLFKANKDTSPHKQSTSEEKKQDMLAMIENEPDKLTAAILAKRLGIASQTVRKILNPEIDSGTITVREGKAGRKYLSRVHSNRQE